MHVVCTYLLWALSLVSTGSLPSPAPAGQDSGEAILHLSWERIVELVRSQGPEVQVAEAEREEVQAALQGADMYTQTNPVLTGMAGRHYPHNEAQYTAYSIRLAWPLDVSGSYQTRAHAAQQRLDAADHHLVVARRQAIFATMDLVLRVRAAADLREFHTRRLELDQNLGDEARQRQLQDASHNAPVEPVTGATVASNDVALAHLLKSQQYAALQRATAEEQANLGRLRRKLGLDAEARLEVPSSLTALPQPAPRQQLLILLDRHPNLAEARANTRAALTQVNLQNRMGIPLPAASLYGGQTPETFGALAVDLPVPIFQRNQAQRAIASAEAHTQTLRAELLHQQYATDVLAAYAVWDGEMAALDSLNESENLAGQAEVYAQQGYLSHREKITQVLVARRESNQAYTALVAARLSAGQARLRLALAAGEGLEQLAGAASAETP